MSKFSKKIKEEEIIKKEKKVTNFMSGVSYEFSPMETLKMVATSSIFAEPQYYRDGEFAPKTMPDGIYRVHEFFKDYSILPTSFEGKTTTEIMETIIDNALDYDFGETLAFAVELRRDYLMRLNPQIIMVRAAMHAKKDEFIKENPGVFDKINQLVMMRGDEPNTQFTYFLYKNKSHKNMPNILKRGWAKKIESLSAYSFNKYKNSGLGMKDLVCLCHPKSNVVDEFMKTGKVTLEENELTWEILKSQGKTWREILSTINLGHMALLRNLRGIFTEIEDVEFCKEILRELTAGVATGMQFPFRYWSAIKAVNQAEDIHHKTLIIDALEVCMEYACDNLPKLKGKTMCLSDNSGSAWGQFTSEYGSVTVAEIDNLSSVIIAKNSDEGYVGKFGDKLIETPVSKKSGVLFQTELITSGKSKDVGASTENGIWLFFDKAISKKEHWDNIFVFSDMQAGHGGLYGINSKEYSNYIVNYRYIDVNKLISEYRKKVNPNVNVFMVQTAGYPNALVPEYGYRNNLLYGWTGKELLFADAMIKFWNVKDGINEEGDPCYR